VADTLSRMFESPSSEVPNQMECLLALTNFPLAFCEFGQLQREDPVLRDIVALLEKGDIVGNYSLSKGILYCRSSRGRELKLVVPAAAIPMVFAFFHESTLGGHLGVFKTISKIRSQFIWKGIDKDIRVCAPVKRVPLANQHRVLCGACEPRKSLRNRYRRSLSIM
jgi:hypothetical protein